jgi:hypothetical protein
MMARAGLMGTVLLAWAMLAGDVPLAAAEPGRGKAAARRSTGESRRARPARPRRAAPPRQAAPDPGPAAVEGGQAPAPATAKPRVYTFGGLDVEGKLKAPQLLYFRGRMRQELDTSNADSRSFLKELERTADEKGL